MKAKNILVTFLAVFVFSSAALTHAETVSTPIVGFQTKSIGAGLSGVGLPLLNPDTLKTSATTLSGQSLGLSGQSNVGSLLNSSKQYYLEVYSGTLKGDRFDLDTAATISAASDSVILSSSSANNTFPVGSIGTSLNGQTIAVRPHLTLADLDTMCSPALVGNNSLSSADSIAFTENGALIYFSKRTDGSWRRSGSAQNFSDKVIPPGTGVFVKKASGSTTLTQTGVVRDNDFARPYVTGMELQAPGFPLDRTPIEIGVVPGSGTTDWFGGTVSTGDYISVISSGALVKYSLRTDGSLVRSGNPSDFKNSSIVLGADAQLVKRSKADPDNVEVDPIN